MPRGWSKLYVMEWERLEGSDVTKGTGSLASKWNLTIHAAKFLCQRHPIGNSRILGSSDKGWDSWGPLERFNGQVVKTPDSPGQDCGFETYHMISFRYLESLSKIPTYNVLQFTQL